MNLCLPLPYDDELMYSVFARHFVYMKPKHRHSAYVSIDGCPTFSTRYVRGAAHLAEKTRSTWQLSGLEIVDRHTLLPFNGAFLKPKAHLRCTHCFMTSNPRGGATALGMNNASVLESKFLRFCASCLREDLLVYGETYWRRQHQLAGTLVCIRHNEILRESTARVSPLHRGTEDATEHCSIGLREGISLNSEEMSLARLIADRSVELLNGGLRRWLSSDLSSQYRMAAFESGYGIGMTKLDSLRFARDFVAFFGQSFLGKIGCVLTENSEPLRAIFYDRGVNHPLIHILVQMVLENGFEKARQSVKRQVVDNTLRRDWKCPNIYAGHDDAFRVPNIRLRSTNRDRKFYFHARCSCGFVFAFTEGKSDDPDMPIVSRMTAYGSAMEVEAKRLFKKHGTILMVSKEMRIDHKVAKRLVEGFKSAFEMTPERIERVREDWLKTQSRSAYLKLLKYDRVWILGRRNSRGYRNGSVPTESDDIALAAQIENAANHLRAEGKKVTIANLEKRLDRCARVQRLKRLPIATAMLIKQLDSRRSVQLSEFEKSFRLVTDSQ